MALVVDSVPLFLDHVWRQLKPVRDAILALGLCYSLKKLALLSRDVYVGLKVFSRVLPEPDLVRKYGKWAVVTGCTAGIGECFVHELAARGFNIILISRSIDKLNLLAKKIEAEYDVETVSIAVDFSSGRSAMNHEEVSAMFDSKEIGVLVNNVGMGMGGHPKFFDENPVDQYWDQLNVNVGAALTLTRMILPQMQARGRGALINLGSRAATRPMPLSSTYSASKAYIQYWSKALATELSPHNIDVLLLEPSYVVTPLTMKYCLTPSLRTPSAKTYVSHAIKTLGWTSQTTGYWPHSLEIYLLGCLFRIPDSGLRKMMVNVRNNVPNVVQRLK